MSESSRKSRRLRRRMRVRRKVAGTSERPRLCVMVSNRNIFAQVVDDGSGGTIVGASTLDKEVNGSDTVAGARELGKRIAALALAKGVSKIVFDRGGFRFHGRVKAVADAAKEAGLCF